MQLWQLQGEQCGQQPESISGAEVATARCAVPSKVGDLLAKSTTHLAVATAA